MDFVGPLLYTYTMSNQGNSILTPAATRVPFGALDHGMVRTGTASYCQGCTYGRQMVAAGTAAKIGMVEDHFLVVVK